MFGIVVTILYLEFRKWRRDRALGGFGRLKTLPVLGIANRFIGKSNDELAVIYNELFSEASSNPFHTWLGPFSVFGIAEPDTLRVVMTSDECLNKSYHYEQMMCPLSIINTEKEIWRPHRRELNAAFNMQVLFTYLPRINEKARLLIEAIDSAADRQPNLYSFIFKCMIDTLAYTTMGVDVGSQTGPGDILYTMLKNAMNNVQERTVRVWLIADCIYRLTSLSVADHLLRTLGYGFLKDIRRKKLHEVERNGELCGEGYLGEQARRNKLNVLEKCLWLQQVGMFSEDQVLNQMCVIYVAGTDTSSIAIFTTLLLLAIHREHQQKVYEELVDVLESPDGDVSYQHLSRLKHLDRVFKESLRLFPPAPVILRKTSADVDVPCGTIPRGSLLVINIKHLHRDQAIWGPNANEFVPDRFRPENSKKRPTFSYMPFSAGPRNCIGMRYAQMSAKIILVHLLRQYEFSSNLRFEDIRVKLHLVMEITNENPIQFRKRNGTD